MRSRALAWASTIALLTAAGVLYAPVVAGMMRQWYDEPESAHGLLLAAAAVFVALKRRSRLSATAVAPSDAGFGVLAFAFVAYLLGSLVGDLFVIRLSLPLALAGGIIVLWGTARARVLASALGLLLLAIPLPAVLVTHLTLPLQLMASQMAAGVLAFCNIPVVLQGNLITLPNITLEVAEACSGLRSVTSLISVAAVCGAVLPLSARRTIVLMVAAVPVAMIGNGLRVAATGLLTTWIGEIAARGFLHELTGFIAFLVMCAATFAIDALTRPRGAAPESQQVHAGSAA